MSLKGFTKTFTRRLVRHKEVMNMNAPIGQQRRMREAIRQERIRKAAPQLLEALVEIESNLSRGFVDENTAFALAELARAAIAAAKGEV